MIQATPEHLESIRTVQAMFFHTQAGKLLLAGIMDEGHVGNKIKTEQQRIEHNFAVRILRSAGIELIPRPADLQATAAPDRNVIDSTLSPQGEYNDE